MRIYLTCKNNKYSVTKEGAKRASKIFSSYLEAKNYAQELADKENGTVVDSCAVQKVAKVVKSSKGAKRVLIVIFIIILIAAVVLGYLNKDKILAFVNSPQSEHEHTSSSQSISEVDSDFEIHFLELGNEYSGDSTFIKAGDIDILIDAGSRQASASTIKSYINQYCTDGKLEYVIITHGDQDHIAGMVGKKSSDSYDGILYSYEVGTIITAAYTNKTTSIYQNLLTAIDYAVNNGAVKYTAAECFNEENGASSTYTLAEGTTMQIMYNKFYFEKSSDENNYSVCTLFTHGNKKFLLTGDLEQEGEEALAEYYSTHSGLSHVDLFKAGHHGSKTSSNDCLLDLITPDICTVCCCAGGSEYTPNYNNVFPTQDFISRIAKHTDAVYVTSLFNEKTLEFESFNGNIRILSDGIDVSVSCSNNNTKLKDSAWFNEIVYVDANNNICSGTGKKDFFTADTTGVTAKPRRVWPS